MGQWNDKYCFVCKTITMCCGLECIEGHSRDGGDGDLVEIECQHVPCEATILVDPFTEEGYDEERWQVGEDNDPCYCPKHADKRQAVEKEES